MNEIDTKRLLKNFNEKITRLCTQCGEATLVMIRGRFQFSILMDDEQSNFLETVLSGAPPSPKIDAALVICKKCGAMSFHSTKILNDKVGFLVE